MLGVNCHRAYAKGRAVIALSSGEAEYYGVVKAASVALGARSMMKDLGHEVSIIVHTDAEAAKGIASRMGLGKTRHIDVHYLWVQERVRSGDLVLQKVKGVENPADLLAKHLSAPDIHKYMSMFKLCYREGRAAVTPTT